MPYFCHLLRINLIRQRHSQTSKRSQHYNAWGKDAVKAGSAVYISSPDQPINRSDATHLLLASILGDGDAILINEDGEGRTSRDWAATCLAGLRIRILRAEEVLPEGLRILMPSPHLAGPSKVSVPDDEYLIQSYKTLTVLDLTCDRIVLLVNDAHALQYSALRYIQFVSRSSASLQLVFCGTRNFFELLENEELTWLRGRLMAGLVLTLATQSRRFRMHRQRSP